MEKTLKEAVLNQLGFDKYELNEEATGTLEDIRNHGINGGFTGFIYYSDTEKFFDDNRYDILSMASEMAQEFGQSVSEMIAGFNCIDLTTQEVEAFLLNLDDENETTLKNALAWFAAEEVARSFE